MDKNKHQSKYTVYTACRKKDNKHLYAYIHKDTCTYKNVSDLWAIVIKYFTGTCFNQIVKTFLHCKYQLISYIMYPLLKKKIWRTSMFVCGLKDRNDITARRDTHARACSQLSGHVRARLGEGNEHSDKKVNSDQSISFS